MSPKESNRLRDQIIHLLEVNGVTEMKPVYPLLHFFEAELHEYGTTLQGKVIDAEHAAKFWEDEHAKLEEKLKRQIEIAESKVEELQEAYQLEQEENIRLVERITDLERINDVIRGELKEYNDRYEYAVIDGTDLRLKIEQHEDRFDQLDGEYQDLVKISTSLYKADREAIMEMLNESLGPDSYERLKNHIGV